MTQNPLFKVIHFRIIYFFSAILMRKWQYTMAGFGPVCPFIICMQKPIEMSCFTIQIIISTHDTIFKMFCQKYQNLWIFTLIWLNKNQFSCIFLGLYYPYPTVPLKFINLHLNWNLPNHLNLPKWKLYFFFWTGLSIRFE